MKNKSSGVNALLICLREDLGANNFTITDHWENDELAIGISSKDNAHILVYISIGIDKPEYYVALENPSSDTLEYEPAGEFNNLNYSEILPIIKKHLGV